MKKILITLLFIGLAQGVKAQDNSNSSTNYNPYPSHKSDTTESSDRTAASDNNTTTLPANVTDGESAKIMVTLNEGEIDAARMAEKRATNKGVKDFAKMMENQHKTNEKETKRIAKTEKIDLKESDTSKALKGETTDAGKTLKSASKEDFDKTYMDQRVAMHQKALDTVNSLIQSAQDETYKQHLEKTRDAISAHLAHAKQVQTIIE